MTNAPQPAARWRTSQSTGIKQRVLICLFSSRAEKQTKPQELPKLPVEVSILPARAGGPAVDGHTDSLSPTPAWTDVAQGGEGWERDVAWGQPPNMSCSMHRAAGRTGQAAPARGLAVNLHSCATKPKEWGPVRHLLYHSRQRARTQLHPAYLRSDH